MRRCWELRALPEPPRHEQNRDGRKRRENKAALPTDEGQQNRGEPGRDQRADRPAALHEAEEKALAAVHARIVEGRVHLVQISCIDGLLGVAQSCEGTHEHQHGLPRITRRRRESGAERGARNRRDHPGAPPEAVDDRANEKRHDRRTDCHQRRDLRLLRLVPLIVKTDLGQQRTEQDEVIHGEYPGEEGRPACPAHVAGIDGWRRPEFR